MILINFSKFTMASNRNKELSEKYCERIIIFEILAEYFPLFFNFKN